MNMNPAPTTSEQDASFYAARAGAFDSDLRALRAFLVIPVFVRSVYGNEHVYVADSDKARELSRLTGSKTLTPSHCDALQALGFTFEHVADPRAKGLASDLFALGASAMRSQANGR